MNASQKHEATFRKVNAARVAARILRPHSGWVRAEWDIPENAWQSALAILRRAAPSIDASKERDFLDAVRWAVEDLRLGTNSGAAIAGALESLTAIAEAAAALADAWASAGHQVQRALETHFSGRLGVGREKGAVDLSVAVNTIVEGSEFAARADRFMSDEAWRVVGEIRPIVEALRECKVRSSPFLHAYVWRIAGAWVDATGRRPTLTRNADAVSGKPATQFERLLREITPPPPPGDRIVREVIEAFAVGDTQTQIQAE